MSTHDCKKFEFLPFLKINFEVDSSESCIKKMYTSKSRHQKNAGFFWLADCFPKNTNGALVFLEATKKLYFIHLKFTSKKKKHHGGP